MLHKTSVTLENDKITGYTCTYELYWHQEKIEGYIRDSGYKCCLDTVNIVDLTIIICKDTGYYYEQWDYSIMRTTLGNSGWKGCLDTVNIGNKNNS